MEKYINITRSETTEKVVLLLEGRLDIASAPAVEEALLTELHNNRNVELNFIGVCYVSSSGLRALLKGAKTAQNLPCSLTISGVQHEIMKIIEMVGFHSILTII